MARRRRPPRAGALSELPPLKIARQIATLQVLFYATGLVLLLFNALIAGSGFGFTLLFGWEGVRGDTTHGWLMAFILVLTGGFFMSVAIVVIVERSKLVPDFALTIHFIHLVVATLYSRQIPRNAMWWAAMLASSAACTAASMWGCRYRELQPVFFGGRRILPASGPERGDEEMGGAAGYEMEPMRNAQ